MGKRKFLNDRESSEKIQHNRKSKKKSKDKESGGFTGTSQPLPEVEHDTTVFEKVFWTGAPGEDPLSESLKTLRKSLGILVRGGLSWCPPPIDQVQGNGLPQSFGKVFDYLNLQTPSAVQKQTWPAVLNGANVIAVAPTGSGKTLSYGMPMIPHIHAKKRTGNKKRNFDPHALILAPTRELVIQIGTALRPFEKLFAITCGVVYGGIQRDQQLDDLLNKGSLDIIAATPGRLIDMVRTRDISLKCVSYLVIDEADRMLQMGFYDQLESLCNQVRPDRQTSLYSATFPGKLREACTSWVKDACVIRCNTFEVQQNSTPLDVKNDNYGSVLERMTQQGTESKEKESSLNKANNQDEEDHVGDEKEENMTETSVKVDNTSQISSLTVSSTIQQLIHVCASHKKPRLLIKYILDTRAREKENKVRQPGAMIIFCTKIKTLKYLHTFLKKQGVDKFEMIHGKMLQSLREKALQTFRCGQSNVLLATDVAARGIHIKKLKYVVNYDFPTNLEQYCHRIGRTGRQGESGEAYSLLTRNLAPLVSDLIKLLQRNGQTVEPNLLALEQEYLKAGFGQNEWIDYIQQKEEEGNAGDDATGEVDVDNEGEEH